MRKAWVVSRAPQYFSKILEFLRVREAVKDWREGADIERVVPSQSKWLASCVKLREDRANHFRARRRFGAEQLFSTASQ